MSQSKRIVAKATKIASNIKNEKELETKLHLVSALNLLTIASSLTNEEEKNRLIQLSDKLI